MSRLKDARVLLASACAVGLFAGFGVQRLGGAEESPPDAIAAPSDLALDWLTTPPAQESLTLATQRVRFAGEQAGPIDGAGGQVAEPSLVGIIEGDTRRAIFLVGNEKRSLGEGDELAGLGTIRRIEDNRVQLESGTCTTSISVFGATGTSRQCTPDEATPQVDGNEANE